MIKERMKHRDSAAVWGGGPTGFFALRKTTPSLLLATAGTKNWWTDYCRTVSLQATQGNTVDRVSNKGIKALNGAVEQRHRSANWSIH